jgi:hypothetical protein
MEGLEDRSYPGRVVYSVTNERGIQEGYKVEEKLITNYLGGVDP